MINTNAFDYINVLDKAADASWMRNEAIANNIANKDTPGYKRQDVNFESQLNKALGNFKYSESMDTKVANLRTSRLKVTTDTEDSGYSYRLDGNNVDPERENALLAENQLKYQGLMDSVTEEFANLKIAMQ